KADSEIAARTSRESRYIAPPSFDTTHGAGRAERSRSATRSLRPRRRGWQPLRAGSCSRGEPRSTRADPFAVQRPEIAGSEATSEVPAPWARVRCAGRFYGSAPRRSLPRVSRLGQTQTEEVRPACD